MPTSSPTAVELHQLSESVGVEPIPERSHVLVRALDCDHEPAEDVKLELRNGDTLTHADATRCWAAIPAASA